MTDDQLATKAKLESIIESMGMEASVWWEGDESGPLVPPENLKKVVPLAGIVLNFPLAFLDAFPGADRHNLKGGVGWDGYMKEHYDSIYSESEDPFHSRVFFHCAVVREEGSLRVIILVGAKSDRGK